MPRKQTQMRGPKDRSAQKQRPPPKRKSTKAQNAFAIAESELPYKPKMRYGRLGDVEDLSKRKRHTGRDMEDSDGPDNKRRRTGDDEDDFSENGGSDGEGHRWRLGEVASDDDSELDSDEAMGSSDEERFEGFSFRGSSTMNSKPKSKKSMFKKSNRQISLSEDVEESEDEDEDEDEDDLGEDAIDLTTAWDMNMAAEEDEEQKKTSKTKKQVPDSDSDEYDSGSESDDSDESNDGSELSMSDDDLDGADEHGLLKLQSFVNSMETSTAKKSRKKSEGHEHSTPTEFGLASTRKLTAADLLPSIMDSRLKNSLKNVDSVVPSQNQTSGVPGKLDAPLPKRQQDRLDREVAYDKSKETLNRWLDTVKANRRAEHLVFPLPDPDAQQSHRMGTAKPRTDLESTIQDILVQSGLAEENGKSAEDQVQEFEELQARQLPLEEIRARRAELRKRRDLLFREEVRAKRIKKIKSKSYRRVHRKEREKLEQKERQALLDAGVDLDEQEREMNERRRAEARMGSKHKDSKWAKSLKQTGRTAWDEDARLGAADLALKEEELRKRIEGKRVRQGDDDYLGSSSSESEDENPWDEEDASDAEKRKLRKKLDRLEGGEQVDSGSTGPYDKLLSMKFMQNAEAAHKAQNDAEVRRLNRELQGEESQSEAESEVGRRKFGNSEKSKNDTKPKAIPRNEFEEAPGSDDEERQPQDADEDVKIVVDRPGKTKPARPEQKSRGRQSNGPAETKKDADEEENPWLVQTNRNNRRNAADDSQQTVDITLNEAKSESAPPKGSSKSKTQKPSPASKSQPVGETNDSDDEESVPVLLKNHDLVKRAFAGDEVVQDFEEEKQETIREEGDQVIDNTLPGWGSWTGDGVSKKQQKRQKRFLTKVEGIKPEQRKDAKLSRVIINEKRIKKNNKYLASQLPHQFETKQQYERSLRMPLGPEWSTKETQHSAHKPRVMIKQGIIKPMEKPMV